MGVANDVPVPKTQAAPLDRHWFDHKRRLWPLCRCNWFVLLSKLAMRSSSRIKVRDKKCLCYCSVKWITCYWETAKLIVTTADADIPQNLAFGTGDLSGWNCCNLLPVQVKVVKILLLDDSGLLLLGIRLNTLRLTRWCDRLNWTVLPIAVLSQSINSILNTTRLVKYYLECHLLTRAGYSVKEFTDPTHPN